MTFTLGVSPISRSYQSGEGQVEVSKIPPPQVQKSIWNNITFQIEYKGGGPYHISI